MRRAPGMFEMFLRSITLDQRDQLKKSLNLNWGCGKWRETTYHAAESGLRYSGLQTHNHRVGECNVCYENVGCGDERIKDVFKVRTLSFAFTFIYRHEWAAHDAAWLSATHQDGQTPSAQPHAIINGYISLGKMWHNGVIVSYKGNRLNSVSYLKW